MENDTWDLVPLLKGIKLVCCKWVYRIKHASTGSVEVLLVVFSVYGQLRRTNPHKALNESSSVFGMDNSRRLWS